MVSPPSAPGSGDRIRLLARKARRYGLSAGGGAGRPGPAVVRQRITVIAAAILLVVSAYAVSSGIGSPGGLTSIVRSGERQVTPATHPTPAPTTPAPSVAPGGSGDTWQFTPPQLRAVPVVPSPVAAAGGPAGVYSGPFGTQRITGGSYAALTFDDGPDPRWTPQVLDLLRTYGVRATFCVVGHAVEAYPDLVRAIADDGHTLCNHSWRHDMALGQRSRDEIRQDLQRTTAAIQAAAPGTPVSYYRQPGGYWTARVVEIAAELGMTSLHWDVDPRDWSKPGVDTIVARVTTQTRPGSIVLLHDGDGDPHGETGDRHQTVEALAQILPELTGRLTLDALPP
jgi:peptidoglycan-N-acetylglucosamine deacetylase